LTGLSNLLYTFNVATGESNSLKLPPSYNFTTLLMYDATHHRYLAKIYSRMLNIVSLFEINENTLKVKKIADDPSAYFPYAAALSSDGTKIYAQEFINYLNPTFFYHVYDTMDGKTLSGGIFPPPTGETAYVISN